MQPIHLSSRYDYYIIIILSWEWDRLRPFPFGNRFVMNPRKQQQNHLQSGNDKITLLFVRYSAVGQTLCWITSLAAYSPQTKWASFVPETQSCEVTLARPHGWQVANRFVWCRIPHSWGSACWDEEACSWPLGSSLSGAEAQIWNFPPSSLGLLNGRGRKLWALRSDCLDLYSDSSWLNFSEPQFPIQKMGIIKVLLRGWC